MKVGLTGGFCSGKSTVGEMFVELGAKLLQADPLAHELMEPGEPVYQEIVKTFGESILNLDKSINRSRLAELAFGTAAFATNIRIQELNEIIHPPVIKLQREWLSAMQLNHPGGVAIVEAALIFEAGLAGDFD
ncbi:MAG: dephospho-CoA kinase, partial [Acidobacteriales bacterium]|nr:dephospho-CoA kinase [Terriglobales bacterium]